MNNETEKLLIEIQELAQCQFLSDLHSKDKLLDARARRLFLEIPDKRYSLAAWSEAANYITEQSSTYDMVSDAKIVIAGR